MARPKFVVGAGVIGAGLIYLMVAGFQQSSSSHMTLATFTTRAESLEGERLQIGGCTVVLGSIEWDEYRHRPRFKVADDRHSLQVRYTGNTVLPDTFKDEALVVMEGYYDLTARQFEAQVVFAKCPSKYEGENYEDHVVALNPGS
jgi:cytochrome c-type biogenesis protein CcmE